MNRRQLVLGALAGSVFARSGSQVMALSREPLSAMREFEGPGMNNRLRVSVADFLRDDIADEQWHRLSALARAPFDESKLDASYSVSGLMPPQALDAYPCAIAVRTVVAGEAAVETTTVVGTLRRGSVVWKVVSWGDRTDDLIQLPQDVLIHVADLKILSLDLGRNDLGEKTGGLWDLLPSVDDLSAGFVTVQQLAPSPEIKFPEEN